MLLIRSALVSLVILSVWGCADKPKNVGEGDRAHLAYTNTSEGNYVTNAVAVEAKATHYVEIEFKPGSSDLSVNSRDLLNSVVTSAQRKGKVSEVVVLSWADQEYPSKNLKSLSKPQRDLAQKRNMAVKNFYKNRIPASVEMYNMASQPSVLSKWFKTKDSKFKNSLVAAGLPTTADALQYPSKASKSMVLVKVE